MSKLLVIDDQEDIRFLLEIYFKRHGFTVESAENGLIGFNKLEQFSPDIVICDIKMPVCNGFEFLKMVDERINTMIPIVFFSAFTGSEENNLQKSKNFAGFFRKPIVCKDLYDRVCEILKLPV